MTTWDTLQLDRLTITSLTVTTNQKDKKKRPTLRRFFVFCQRTVSTFAKPLKANPQTKALQKNLPLPSLKLLTLTD